TVEVLSRPKNVEVAEASRLQPAFLGEHPAIKLAIELGDSVRAFRFGQHRLNFRDDRVVAIDGGRTAEDQLFHPRFDGLLKNDQRSCRIDLIAFNRLEHGFGYADERGQMENEVHSDHGPAHRLAIKNGALDEVTLKTRQVALETRAQVVENPDLSLVLEMFHDVTAN